jgi:hypothetical protein
MSHGRQLPVPLATLVLPSVTWVWLHQYDFKWNLDEHVFRVICLIYIFIYVL